jgi:hypothetical protein
VYVLTKTATAVVSTHALSAHVVGCPDRVRILDVFPHLVQGHCTDQTVLYGAGEQVGTGLLHQHSDDVGSGALMGRCAAPQTVQVCCVKIV